MEVMMSSPIQTCAEMENNRAAADDLLKYQETERKMLVRKLVSKRPHVGMIQVNPNADLGATALVQLSKRQSKKNRKLLRELIQSPEIKLEVARQIVDMITHPSIPDYSMITESSIQEISNTELGTTANVQSHEHKSTEKLLGEHIENPENKLEVARQNVDVMTQSSIQDNANIDLGTAATVELSRSQGRTKRMRGKLPREDTENPESKPEVPRQNVDDIIQSKSSILKREGYMEIDKVEKGSSRTISGDVKSGSEREEYTEIVNGMGGSSRNATSDVKPSSRSEEQTEVGNRAIGAHNAKSTMLKGDQNMNIAISETVSSGTAIIDAGSKREEYMVSASDETALGTIATPNAKMVLKGEEHTEVANGENLNPQQLEDMEVANGEMDSGTTETDNTVSKKRKRQMLENKNPASGEILGTSVGTITIVENTGSRETSTLDAKTASKVEECTSISRKKEKKKKLPRIPTSEKKLLVFDVNGLLADIVFSRPKDARADFYFSRGAVFKRPFLDDFLRFCFEKFHVALWSSRTKKVLDPVVNYLLRGCKHKLLFIWDASICSRTGMGTLENYNKYIVFKDLRKIWENSGRCKIWAKGTFNDSNTLLLDDSPYKALLNPKHNGIFPESYSYKNKDDNFLGPTGELRTYLEGVAATDNLKMYVEQHPFGQSFIDEKDPNWSFYEGVLKGYQTSITN